MEEAVQFFQLHLLKRLLSSLYTLCLNAVSHVHVGLFVGSKFSSIGLCIYFSDNTMLFWLWLQVRECVLPALFFLSQDCFAYSGSLVVYTKFRIFCSISAKNATRIVIGIALNLFSLGNMDILTMLIFPIHEDEISLHFFLFSSISLNSVVQFSVYSFFTSYVKFIPTYFIYFVGIVNGVIFFISL